MTGFHGARSRIAVLLSLGVVASVIWTPATYAGEAPPASVRFLAVGDTFLGLSIGRRIVRDGPGVVFAHVADRFADADIVLANLECSLSKSGAPWPRKLLHFAGPPKGAAALAIGGIDAVTLANNHTLDYGRSGFTDTQSILDANGVRHVGGGSDAAAARSPLIIERNGLRVATLSYVVAFSGPIRFNTRAWEAGEQTPGIAIARPAQIAADVIRARQMADVVVVAVHSGGEFRTRPNTSQRRMAAAAIEAGASLVVGHGPHVLQGYRQRGRTLIAYSLGNFVFPGYTGRSNDSAILDVRLSASGVESFNWIPVVVRNGFPRLAEGADATRILAQLQPI